MVEPSGGVVSPWGGEAGRPPSGDGGGSTAATPGGGINDGGDGKIAPFLAFRSPLLVLALLSRADFGTRFLPVNKKDRY